MIAERKSCIGYTLNAQDTHIVQMYTAIAQLSQLC